MTTFDKEFNMETVHNFGINDKKYPVRSSTREISKEYATWRGMIGRCYHRTENRKKAYKSYEGCHVSIFFKYYSNFYEWANSQIGFGVSNYDLDKDLLKKGNKIYSEDFCVFLPSEINTAIQAKRSDRGYYPIGVYKHTQTGRFISRMRRLNKNIHIGIYNTPEEAFYAYKEKKEEYLRYLAEKHKSYIDERAYLALINYEVDITD